MTGRQKRWAGYTVLALVAIAVFVVIVLDVGFWGACLVVVASTVITFVIAKAIEWTSTPDDDGGA